MDPKAEDPVNSKDLEMTTPTRNFVDQELDESLLNQREKSLPPSDDPSMMMIREESSRVNHTAAPTLDNIAQPTDNKRVVKSP